MTEKLDLTLKENWNEENAEEIALMLGFICNDLFLEILEDFIKNTVVGATMTNFLVTLAIGRFKSSGADKK